VPSLTQVSYVEIYNEALNDLLVPSNSLKVVDTADKGVHVSGLHERGGRSTFALCSYAPSLPCCR
jgi:hypothetical protein